MCLFYSLKLTNFTCFKKIEKQFYFRCNIAEKKINKGKDFFSVIEKKKNLQY